MHTGAGTPLVMSVQSGSAPKALRLVDLVEDAEVVLHSRVMRAVVIDAEGGTFDILAAFVAARHVIVTPLKPSRAPELEPRCSRGSYYRPCREHDALRGALWRRPTRDPPGGGLTNTIVAMHREQDGLCALCHEPLDIRDTSQDHIIPVHHGGGNERANIQLAHKPCNSKKRERVDPVALLRYLEDRYMNLPPRR